MLATAAKIDIRQVRDVTIIDYVGSVLSREGFCALINTLLKCAAEEKNTKIILGVERNTYVSPENVWTLGHCFAIFARAGVQSKLVVTPVGKLVDMLHSLRAFDVFGEGNVHYYESVAMNSFTR